MSKQLPEWQTICAPETAAPLDAGKFYSTSATPPRSAIDDYYDYVEHLLTLGNPVALNNSATLGRLLLLGLVTGVELYARSVLAGLIYACPVSRKYAADQQIPFGSVDFYDRESVGWALFDGISLAGGDELRKKTKSLLGFELPKNSSVDGALDEFDKLCHLRHASVHSRGALGRRNMAALGLSSATGPGFSVSVSFGDLQDAGAVCHSFVRSYNRFLFKRTIERWRAASLFSGTWSADKDAYDRIYRLFHSARDNNGPANSYQSYRAASKLLIP